MKLLSFPFLNTSKTPTSVDEIMKPFSDVADRLQQLVVAKQREIGDLLDKIDQMETAVEDAQIELGKAKNVIFALEELMDVSEADDFEINYADDMEFTLHDPSEKDVSVDKDESGAAVAGSFAVSIPARS